VLRVVVQALRQAVSGSLCAILDVDAVRGKFVIAACDRAESDTDDVALAKAPELKLAFQQARLVITGADGLSKAAVPMISQETVIGLIYLERPSPSAEVSESLSSFFEVVASTAANAVHNARLFEEVERKARTDFMTGLANYRFFQATLIGEFGRAQRHNHDLSLLMIDLDFLKQVNDRYGHPNGDLVIRTVAATIKQSCRASDFAARYGGEEFAVILPETSLEGAVVIGERIRHLIAQITFPVIGCITASIGVSNYPVNAMSHEDLVRVADQALYQAKHDGRNRVAYFKYQPVI